MTDLDRVAKLATSLPIGIKLQDESGKFVKPPIDKTDNFIDVSAYLMSVVGAQNFVKNEISKIDTTDKISDSTISAKIDTLQAALATTTA
ncbi:hypothetical protein NBRC111452_1269 [Companilactobacillus farciminis]|nr:hypothetical protein NBRC111452_1269 [Companilactobacillus farciminis]